MGKFTTYILIMTGTIIISYFAGILPPETANSTLLNLVLDPQAYQNSALTLKAILAIEGITAAAIIVGFAISGNLELGVMTSATLFLLNLFWDILAIFNIAFAVNEVFALFLFSPLMFLWVVTTIEWWRGVTT